MSRMRLHRNVNQVEASADEKLKFYQSLTNQPTRDNMIYFGRAKKITFSTTLTDASLLFLVLQPEQKDALRALTNDET